MFLKCVRLCYKDKFYRGEYMESDSAKHSAYFLRLLSIFVFIGLLGAVKPVLFNEGSAPAKYLAKQKQLEMVQEENVEAYMESALFGDANVEFNGTEQNYSEEERNQAASIIFQYDSVIAAVLIFCSLLLLVPKILDKTPLYHSLLLMAVWLIALSIATSLNGGKKFSELALLAHATRWGLPLVLWLAVFYSKREKDIFKSKPVLAVLVLCSSFTFAVHGWEAFCLNPSFQDLVYNFTALLGWDIPTSVNSSFLKAVGCMDICLAIGVLFFRKTKLVMWMAFWGIITALSRPLTLGFDAWPETAMRIANFALPFSLYLIYRTQEQTQASTEAEINTKMETLYD